MASETSSWYHTFVGAQLVSHMANKEKKRILSGAVKTMVISISVQTAPTVKIVYLRAQKSEIRDQKAAVP